MRGTIASPHYCNLLISRNDTSGKVTMFNTYMFLDNSELTMKVAHLDSMQFVHPFLAKSAATKARVEGGALQREYYEYYESLFPLLNAANQADANVSSLNFIGNYTPEEYDRKFDELYPKKQAAMEAADEAKMQFIRQHPHSPLSLFIISELLNNPFERTREEVKELTEIASHIEDTVRLPQVLKMAETARTLYKGAKYKDLELTDRLAAEVLEELRREAPEDIAGQLDDNIHWIRQAGANRLVVGSQARILYADSEGRTQIALAFNRAVADGRLHGPVVLGRDHHDVSGTDSPYRETSNIYDGSAFTADMAVHNMVGDSFRGATWVSLHNGGGVGWGEVVNGGFGMVVDGTSRPRNESRTCCCGM